MLRSYDEFINESKLNWELENLLKSKKCYLSDGKWNCDGNLHLGSLHRDLYELLINKATGELTVQFGIIKGKFTLRGYDKGSGSHIPLKNMKGMPSYVGGNFMLPNHALTSLVGMPTYVGEDINLQNNQLTSLEGLTESCKNLDLARNKLNDLKTFNCNVKGTIKLQYNKLTTLEEIPEQINCKFIKLHGNKLTNLKGLNMIESFKYDLMDNKLTSLKGAPKRAVTFVVSKNPTLKSLEGMPIVRGDENTEDQNERVYEPYDIGAPQMEIDWYFKVGRFGYDDYWKDCFEYTANNNIDAITSIEWPKDLLDRLGDKYKHLLQSSMGIKKYSL